MTAPVTSVIVQSTEFYGAGLYIQDGTIEWETEETGQNGAEVGICRFTTRLGATLPFIPKKHMYVELLDTPGGTLRFAGRIKTVERLKQLGIDTPQYVVECQDWMAELDGIYVSDDFVVDAGANDKDVVQQIVDLYWSQLATTGMTHVIYASHHNLPAIEITQGSLSLRGLLDFVARLAGASYYLDPYKQLHWNDVTELGTYVLDDANKTGSYRSFFALRHYDDATGQAFRMTVIGAAGVAATVIDEPGYNAYARQRRYERGAPAERIPTLPDYTDQSLTTVAECAQEGWRILREQQSFDSLEVELHDTFVYPGQLVYLVDEQGLEEDADGWFDEEDLAGNGDPTRIGLALDLYLVRGVQPRPLGGGHYTYTAILGAYRPSIERLQKAA